MARTNASTRDDSAESPSASVSLLSLTPVATSIIVGTLAVSHMRVRSRHRANERTGETRAGQQVLKPLQRSPVPPPFPQNPQVNQACIPRTGLYPLPRPISCGCPQTALWLALVCQTSSSLMVPAYLVLRADYFAHSPERNSKGG